MIVGVPKETKVEEHRVALTPHGARELKNAGHLVLVGQNAGKASGFSNQAYQEAGAHIILTC